MNLALTEGLYQLSVTLYSTSTVYRLRITRKAQSSTMYVYITTSGFTAYVAGYNTLYRPVCVKQHASASCNTKLSCKVFRYQVKYSVLGLFVFYCPFLSVEILIKTDSIFTVRILKICCKRYG